MAAARYANRLDAGRHLAAALSRFVHRDDVMLLALPRGGVPVAAAIGRELGLPWDVFLVRKLGVPGYEELAMGAIAQGGIEVLDRALIRDLRIPEESVTGAVARERDELVRRERVYRGARPAPAIAGRTVLLVDDGLATGASMEAAVNAIRQLGPARVVVAVPVGAPDTCVRLRGVADEVVCPLTPRDFNAVGAWYDDFTQTTDAEVLALLAEAVAAASPPAAANPPGHPEAVVSVLRRHLRPLTGSPRDYDALVEAAAGADVVLLGEATHGTHEFYRERAVITGRLIAEHGFAGVVVEADWPDAYWVNRYVRGAGSDADATEALADFRRFPSWMWRNADVLDFVGWLRSYNEGRPGAAQAGFYGLDLYSLHASMRAVVAVLERVDPAAADRARHRYACFDRFGTEVQHYAQTTGLGLTSSCERDVLDQLLDMRRQAAEWARRDGRLAPDDLFVAEQNARVVRNAEAYYRTMLGGHVESWNLRDRHMFETLLELRTFLGRTGPSAKLVVWAHNSHLGDARATEMGESGELNVGQLARERFGDRAWAVGFTTHTGTVTAATAWDGPAHRRHVRPSLASSCERLLHDVGVPRFLLLMRGVPEVRATLAEVRLERAIGVLYQPQTERRSHYFHARLPDQFDAVIHVDETRAVEPLERTSLWDAAEVAETFPSGL